MTVSQIHDYMAEKVIPESVMPQNIAAFLMGEDGTIPEMDAFTFLNRVRALGIGSADFLYLLKGCNAPEEAVDKIENNPAMNLSNLIVTLDNSGLTSQDYTRMLYTARQIWERTLTMRIDKAAVAEAADEPDLQEDEQFPEAPAERSVDKILTARQLPKKTTIIEDIQHSREEENARKLNENEPPQAPEKDKAEVMTARQLPKKPQQETETSDEEQPEVMTARQLPKKEYIGRDDYDAYYDEDRPVSRHNGKIAVAAVFSAVLIGLCGTMEYFGIKPVAKEQEEIACYQTEQLLFNDIYNSYSNGIIGSDSVYRYSRSRCELFGDLLIEQPEELGVYTLGGKAFVAEPDAVTIYELSDKTAAVAFTVSPPEGAEFIEAIPQPDMLTLVFADEDSAGIIACNSSGEVAYSAEQSGVLTDIYVGSDTVSLGTVYTPPFTHSFTVQQTECYLPQFILDGEAVAMQPYEVLVTPSTGCSYAVHGCYNLSDGSVASRTAALGSPVFSGAEEFFALLKTADGYSLLGRDTASQQLVCADTTGVTACDIGNSFETMLSEEAQPYDSNLKVSRRQAIVATAETSETGTDVYIRGIDMKPLAVLTNISGTVTGLKMQDGVLYIFGENGVLVTANITAPQYPEILLPTAAKGMIKGDTALCTAISDGMVKLTLYRKTDSGIAEAGSTTRIITVAEKAEASLCSGSTIHIGEELYGAAFSYFDGVSWVSEYAVFGKTKTAFTLFDEGNFNCAVELDGSLYLLYDEGCIKVN